MGTEWREYFVCTCCAQERSILLVNAIPLWRFVFVLGTNNNGSLPGHHCIYCLESPVSCQSVCSKADNSKFHWFHGFGTERTSVPSNNFCTILWKDWFRYTFYIKMYDIPWTNISTGSDFVSLIFVVDFSSVFFLFIWFLGLNN